MITDKEAKVKSKFLSFVLRHHPEFIGLELDANGWAVTAQLIEKVNANGHSLDAAVLDYIVNTNSKKRFAYNNDKTMIRANQGHSVDIDLGLFAAVPPEYLYHGTGSNAVDSILATGLEKRERQHVHLGSDIQIAIAVGGRHGKPKVFKVAAGQMHVDGYAFYLSENGVWLIDNVPATYLELI
ncbi:RNA 2'-phosphotransferase [Mucilaginibacter limnophilus]|uniref:Probable RNA 2'-phosphotransferase n=1 Tax=Mucilaginibacter limnophilus TaxID=1932778 RepID=A0A437MUW2_9SPHI|nr:RNA 2'-phosphotransferase [Mucilaginibacter limnophilus]RVU01431.1 RNA 2'-phosphotransferase [Mucilaginibacter limnophilus]